MSEALKNSFAGQLERLKSRFRDVMDAPSVESAFVRYVYSEVEEDGRPFDFPGLPFPKVTMLSTAPELAVFGYSAALAPRVLRPEQSAAWIGALDRLRGRDALPQDRQAFTFRPLELFGICLGVKHLHAPAEYAEWLSSLFLELQQRLRDQWSICLLLASRAVLGNHPVWRIRTPLVDWPIDDLALLLWLRESATFGGGLTDVDEQTLRRDVLYYCAKNDPEPLDGARAAVMHFALQSSVDKLLASQVAENWQVGRPTKDALALVTELCERFPRLVRQLGTRHDKRDSFPVNDEYDVQDLFRALLSLFFNDVRDEEWTPSYAGTSSRTDFLLWEERLAVETKMTRRGLDQRKVADELIIDIQRYQTHGRCRTLVCFVYDPEHRCKRPAALENDLNRDSDPLVRVIVAPRQ